MDDLPPLPDDVDEQIGDLAERTLAAREAGNFAEVIRLSEESWAVLPEPKVNWEFEPQAIARGTVEDIAASGLGAQLDVWVKRMYAAYFDPNHEDLLLNMLEANALFVNGRTDEAVTIFKKVHEVGGPAWFNGDDRKYLDLVK